MDYDEETDDTSLKSIEQVIMDYVLRMKEENQYKLLRPDYYSRFVGFISKLIVKYMPPEEVIRKEYQFYQEDDEDDIMFEDWETKVTKIARFYVKVCHLFCALRISLAPSDKPYCQARKEVLDRLFNTLNKTPHQVSQSVKTPRDSQKTLVESPVPDLKEYYHDSGYDKQTGGFTRMSPSAERDYQTDLQEFYQTYTGNPHFPEKEIQSFADISWENCADGKCEAIQSQTDHSLIRMYARNLRNMVNSTKYCKRQLSQIANSLFETDKQVIQVREGVTYHMITRLVEKTQEIIKEMRTNCEDHYITGLLIYEALLERQIFKTTQKQIQSLENERRQLIMPSS
jgi:hemerythrin-like domain-containing protein